MTTFKCLTALHSDPMRTFDRASDPIDLRSKISTSIVERQNLTMRRSIRRFTRLPNGFSKKWENPIMLWLYILLTTILQIAQTLNDATSAMAVGLSKSIWT